MDELQRLANAHCAQKFIQLDVKHFYYDVVQQLYEYTAHNTDNDYAVQYCDYLNGIQSLVLTEIPFPNVSDDTSFDTIVIEIDDSQYKIVLPITVGAVATCYQDASQSYHVGIRLEPPNRIVVIFDELQRGTSSIYFSVLVPIIMPVAPLKQAGMPTSVIISANDAAADEDEES